MTQFDLFQEYLNRAPEGLADWVINVVDTAKALKLGLEEKGMEVDDSTLLEESVSIVTAWKESSLWEVDPGE